jgi:hypothetical protein
MLNICRQSAQYRSQSFRKGEKNRSSYHLVSSTGFRDRSYQLINITKRYQAAPTTVAHLQVSRSSRVHYPLSPLSAEDQFRHVISRFIHSTMAADNDQPLLPPSPQGLKKIVPYWYPYTTMAKGRWLGREILEMVSTEFRDRSMEYYVR